MTNPVNSSPNGEIHSTATDTTNVVQPTAEQLAQIEADKLALQSEYTRTRQALIESNVELAKANPTYLNSIKDTKLQNSVVKQLYGFDTYEQAVAVLGQDFNAPSEEGGNGDEDRTLKLEREIKLMKYNSSKSEVENAIKDYKLTNPQYFVDPSAEDKLREELKFISGELPVSERIKRASQIALVPSYDPTSVAYQVLNSWSIVNWGNVVIADNRSTKEVEVQKQIEAGRRLFWLPTPPQK